MLRPHRDDKLLSRIDMVENVVGINLPRIATLGHQTADKVLHYDAKFAQWESRLDRELQRRRLEAEASETARAPDPSSHKGAGSLPRPSQPNSDATSTTLYGYVGLASLNELEENRGSTSVSMPQATSVTIPAHDDFNIGSLTAQPTTTYPPLGQTVDELLQRMLMLEDHLRMTAMPAPPLASSAMLGLTTQHNLMSKGDLHDLCHMLSLCTSGSRVPMEKPMGASQDLFHARAAQESLFPSWLAIILLRPPQCRMLCNQPVTVGMLKSIFVVQFQMFDMTLFLRARKTDMMCMRDVDSCFSKIARGRHQHQGTERITAQALLNKRTLNPIHLRKPLSLRAPSGHSAAILLTPSCTVFPRCLILT